MKYPIDPLTAETMFGHLIASDRAQRQLILALSGLLREAMGEMGSEDTPWYDEAEKLFKIQHAIKMDHETRIFNAKNGHPENHTVKIEGPIDIGPMPPGEVTYVPGVKIDPEMSARMTEAEKGFGEEMSEADLARHFNESTKRNRPKETKPRRLKDMSQSEINHTSPEELQKLVDEAEEEEHRQENSTDIYKIKGRIQNLAVSISGGNLTPVGEMMVNSFVHVVKDLYDFADTLTDNEIRNKLIEKVKKHESMPGTLIAAASAGVKVKK